MSGFRNIEEAGRPSVKQFPALSVQLAQAWNHQFFWECLTGSPSPTLRPGTSLSTQLEADFGSLDSFREKFSQAAASLFGSGWAWLVWDQLAGKLRIVQTSNERNTIFHPTPESAHHYTRPILTIDVWEHSYYVNYENRRSDFIRQWWTVCSSKSLPFPHLAC